MDLRGISFELNFMLNLFKRFVEWRYRRLISYRKRDAFVEKLMKNAIVSYYQKLPSFKEKDEELKEILKYKTGLWEAATVQTLVIWGGNRGFKNAVQDEKALNLAATLRLAFGFADMMDTDNDEYDPKVLKFKSLSEKKFKSRIHKHEIYQGIVKRLDKLILKRFKELHPNSYRIYKVGKKVMLKGQEEDIKLHFSYLKNDLRYVRKKYTSIKEIMELLVKKLGLMGKFACDIVFVESGGKNEELKETLEKFYTNSGTLLQFWSNDVKNLWLDVKKLDTNPIITYAVCKYKDEDRISKELLMKLLKEEPSILERMAKPYEEEMKDSLKKIKSLNFDPRSHEGLALMVNKEKKRKRSFV